MLKSCGFSFLRCYHLPFPAKYHGRQFSNKACDPLRILFCGSDEFSIASLQALALERRANPKLVADIDVVCRPDKPVQRGLKALREGSNGCWTPSLLHANFLKFPLPSSLET